MPQARSARVTIVDQEHGSPLPASEKMGDPQSPTVGQIAELRKAAALPPATSRAIENGILKLELQPHALALIEISK
jgi:hypothetical protein